jgi:hypothetical protein
MDSFLLLSYCTNMIGYNTKTAPTTTEMLYTMTKHGTPDSHTTPSTASFLIHPMMPTRYYIVPIVMLPLLH